MVVAKVQAMMCERVLNRLETLEAASTWSIEVNQSDTWW